MKNVKILTTAVLAVATLASPVTMLGADQPDGAKVKPYPLKTCIVSGEKLDSMDKPYVFTNGNREIKLCCKDCLKDFKKDPAKYTKKLEAAEAKGKKQG